VASCCHARHCRRWRLELCLALCAERLGAWRALAAECCRDDGVQIVHVERVLAKELAAAGRVSFLVACAEVLADEGPGLSVPVLGGEWVAYLWQSGKSQL
jgi:hypothetical protein